ncbi:GNVR domain-containing protein [uncultured Desulfobacter sp.]|uniref:GumC family protein n=1 Tax=uncultured Desulfobacter sp. TaxID=240139 RepID=UPI002AA6C140|nr:GNVR domain-containing protein [uncultured Desulfobacter sp.]
METKIITNDALIRTSVQELMKQGVSLSITQSRLKAFLKKIIINPLKRFAVNLGLKKEAETVSLVDQISMKIASNLKTVILPGSNIIEVKSYHNNPAQGALILGSMFDNYLKFRHKLFSDPNAGDLFREQTKTYIDEIDQLQQERLKLLKDFSISDIHKEIVNQLDIILSMKKDLFVLEDEFLEKQMTMAYMNKLLLEYEPAKNGQYKPFPYDFDDEKIKNFSNRLDDLLFEYHDTLRVFKADTKKGRFLKNQINKLWIEQVELIRKKIELQKNDLETLSQIIDTKKKNIAGFIDRNEQLIEVQSRLGRLDSQISLLKKNYETFYQKLEESKIEQASEASQMSNVQILSRPSIPDKPFFPRKIIVIPLGILTGFLIGISVALIREFFDNTYKTPFQVTRHLNLPCIGSIGYSEEIIEQPVITKKMRKLFLIISIITIAFVLLFFPR